MKLIKSGKFEKVEKRNYIRRLATKLLAAQAIAEVEGAIIFDSLEYVGGFQILQKKNLISENIKFGSHIFNSSEGYDRLIEYCEKEYFAPSKLFNNTPYSFWAPLALFERTPKYPDELLTLLRAEIERLTPEMLDEEIRDCKEDREKFFRPLKKYWSKCGSILWSLVTLREPSLSYLSIIYDAMNKLWKSEISLNSKFSVIAQLIVVALEEEERHYKLHLQAKVRHWWINWVQKLFKRPSPLDRIWDLTQRKMGEWARIDHYVPFYEGSRYLLTRYRLV